ncbi:Peptidoglycan deacetylase [Penicillium subrubescens]|uniref:Peptidoglycan deacetylase n=1 Tax=Penicillium subrubescens TaxID=1316194 RepID=A0A1Q5UP26_9EURO|nr:Peptidoglycan deacetylase [Penicillium subrubescens]KAJ5883773.1 Peptidoglycan deacetylase [Penicillium subrubescens]OKP14237.1 Peptidoglycan deacetylase [Penicillium subrubescens]
MSFLGIEGYHVFITGAAGGIGQEAVKEFLGQGCKVTGHDLRHVPTPASANNSNFYSVTGDISCEESVASCIKSAVDHFGPINILIANAGITDESSEYNIWEIPLDIWEKTYNTNIRGTFLTIKHFLQSAKEAQTAAGNTELENLAIVVTGSETGKFGQAGHTEYASGKAGLQYGLVRGVKNEIVKINSKARINAVAPGWVDTPLIAGRLDDPKEMWNEAQATVPLKKIAQPEDVARTMAFLASHRAAGHITGQCLSVDGGMEGRVIWRADEVLGKENTVVQAKSVNVNVPQPIVTKKRRIQILLSVDFDAVSGFLGTGASETNSLSDYSSGYFAAQVGVPRLLRLFKKHGISSSVTWFVPGHSMESFPNETKAIVESGAEVGCHGYAHEGAAQMTEEQEREVIIKCVQLATELTGQKPRGWRAPLYLLREHTVKVLEEFGFLYDTSLTHHDSALYFLPELPPIKPIDFSPSQSATTWMKPLAQPGPRTDKTLVEIPCNWYMEDMTPMQFIPAANNSHGFVSPTAIEENWKSRFEFLYNETEDFVFPLVLHPDTSGMAHVIGMIDRMITWLKQKGDEVEFVTFENCAKEWKAKQDK